MQIINESPDEISSEKMHWNNASFVFGYVDDIFLFAFKTPRLRIHSDLIMDALNSGGLKPHNLSDEWRETGYIGRDSFNMAGRGWINGESSIGVQNRKVEVDDIETGYIHTKSVLSFWHNPSKSELGRLINDLKSNGVNIDSSWKIEVGNKLVPIDEYGDSNKYVKVQQIDHVLDPIEKQKNRKDREHYVKSVPSGFNSMVQYHASEMTSEGLNMDILDKINLFLEDESSPAEDRIKQAKIKSMGLTHVAFHNYKDRSGKKYYWDWHAKDFKAGIHDLDQPRVIFNDGYHDGASDAKNNRRHLVLKGTGLTTIDEIIDYHPSKTFGHGYAKGYKDQNEGIYKGNSDDAWGGFKTMHPEHTSWDIWNKKLDDAHTTRQYGKR